MSEPIHDQLPSPGPEGGALSDHLGQLDRAREVFFAATTRYTRIPVDTYAQRVEEGAEIVSNAMLASAGSILRDDSIEPLEKGSMIATLYQDDDNRRVTHFGDLTNKALFTETVSERESIIQGIARDLVAGTNWDEVLAKFMHDYRRNIGIDVDKLTAYATLSWNAKALQIGRAIGKHTFDIAKTSAGIAVGVGLALRWARKQQ